MCAQIDREHVGKLDPTAVANALGQSLDDNVDLMWRTPNSQNLMFGTYNNAGHNTSVSAHHGVFAIG